MAPSIYSLTLAAGAGSRMPAEMRAKACCKIGNCTVIENLLDVFEEAGVRSHVVVVGCEAEQVMEQVSRSREGVLFAYQGEQRGTGHAVQCGLEVLHSLGHEGDVLIVAGDKVVAPQVVRGMVEGYQASACEFYVCAGRSTEFPTSGRIVQRGGAVQAVVEVPDIRVTQLARRLAAVAGRGRAVPAGRVVEIAQGFVKDHGKLRRYFPALEQWMDGPKDREVTPEDLRAASETARAVFELPGGAVSVEEIARAPLSNLSVYVGRTGAIAGALAGLQAGNVQGEYYFTDVVERMAAAGKRVGVYEIRDRTAVMSFNTADELEEVRKVHAVRMSARREYPKLEAWINFFSGGAHADPLALKAAEGLAREIGPERPCIVARAPGRINVMGRHVDHQGGTCNLMAIDRATVVVASPRSDDRINLWNTDGDAYPPRSFSIAELTEGIDWEDWLGTLDSQFIQQLVARDVGDWVNYVKGAALRLQHRFMERKLTGMDAFVCGNIPVAAGLSSSSALVVSAAEALTELNALNLRPMGFVDLCGEGEWFVGTRGGSADHAAMKFSRENEVVSVSFLPFRVLARSPFPAGFSLMVCHSGVYANKTRNARARFNANVACYHMAREMTRANLGDRAGRVEHLRDITTEGLGLSLPALYSLIGEIPAELGAREVEAMAAAHPAVAKCLAGVDLEQARFRPRDVALFGLAECRRAEMARGLLTTSDAQRLGGLMNISHDGDRVVKWSGDADEPFDSRASDERMASLARSSAELAPLAETGSALWQQPGAYACSTPEIDRMVDLIGGLPGVLGAQLAGAGLGGCMMVLLETERAAAVEGLLAERYYAEQGIEPQMFVCRPSTGSKVMTSLDGD